MFYMITLKNKNNSEIYTIKAYNLLTVFKYLLQSEKIYCQYSNRLSQYITINFKKLLLAFYSVAITLFIYYNFYIIDKSYTQSKIILDNIKSLCY